ncbi:alanine--tRNA ligase, mitochondrial isoform X2 [Venturia canescens]|uniref:alanine--tRNA ligase, mitochondrial isoform X2 n=1 Tax=Venturia canescens TaxID=32260 RepID=UPI001C9D1A0D|nr:alanine--tRNA ligase, mitochondrial isoform X2 [Venturia canescens]
MLNRQLYHLRKMTIIRSYNTNGMTHKSSRIIRKEFLEYFTKDLNHTYVPSSPVLPMNDPTLSFVNAGMNQFKGVFLGHHNPPAVRVANSQKCIRVGGKHNDLETVGLDTYHHTFFEMLGNWSFEACEYAWNLLTGPYGLKKEHLYVTYFAGDEKLGFEADLECKEIWRRLGVPDDRLLPFGLQYNFWEMGLSGPCGPCTEIHVDHTMQTSNQSSRVNKGYHDLTELWNLVFIQYQRFNDGPIVALDKYHVDTGMGFERLVTIIQGKRSNYDTDLFTPLFEAIEKLCHCPKYGGRFGEADKNSIDTAYRILADHARMITVALADGMIPEYNPKLRKVLRKAITVGEDIFHRSDILCELTHHVAENLGDVYPEISKNLPQIQQIIKYEQDVRKSLKKHSGAQWQTLVESRPALAKVSDSTAPGLVGAYRDLQNTLADLRKTGILNGDFAVKLYDTYGLAPETISELASIESLSFEKNDFFQALENIKMGSKIATGQAQQNLLSPTSLRLLESKKVKKTDDKYKYRYTFNENSYEFPPVDSKLMGFVVNGKLISETEPMAFDEDRAILKGTVAQSGKVVGVNSIIDATTEIGIILDKTPFYSPEGGQLSDKGFIKIGTLLFHVEKVYKMRGYVIHVGHFVTWDTESSEAELQAGDDCVVTIDGLNRTALMRNHTATHLLNAALRKVLPIISQRSSLVSKENLMFQFNIFGEQVNTEHVANIEKLINDCVGKDIPVDTKIVNMAGLLAEKNLTIIPGEVYPDTEIRIVEIDGENLKSKEACCGTHVHKTGVLEHFCVLSMKSQGTTSRTIKAVAGPLARLARLAGENAKQEVVEIEEALQKGHMQPNIVAQRIDETKRRFKNRSENKLMSYLATEECIEKLNDLLKILHTRESENMKNSLEAEMKNVVCTTTMPFVVHCLQPINTTTLEDVSLERVTNLCTKTPVLVIAHTSGKVKARCCVPKEMITSSFNAESWMNIIVPIFRGQATAPKGEDPALVRHMRVARVPKKKLSFLVDKAINAATKFATININETKHENS